MENKILRNRGVSGIRFDVVNLLKAIQHATKHIILFFQSDQI